MPGSAELYYHYYEGGSLGQKPPVVLIHGAGGTHLYWPAEIRRLPGYRVYAPDLPGHGKSAGRGLQSIAGYREAILEWINALGLHNGVIVGHSMGSAIALQLALENPEKVSGLVLIGAGARLRVASEIIETVQHQTTFLNAVRWIVERSFSTATPPRLKELAGQRMAQTRQSVLHGDFRACDEFDERVRVCQIEKPTLILCGEDDKLTPARSAQFLAEHIPGAQLQIISDSGHMTQLEQPRLVAEALLGFLAGIRPY